MLGTEPILVMMIFEICLERGERKGKRNVGQVAGSAGRCQNFIMYSENLLEKQGNKL